MAHMYKYMMHEDYKKLTKVQLRVLERMRTETLILVHTEGVHTRCWLETIDGEIKETIRKTTANALFALGAIQNIDPSEAPLYKPISSQRYFYHMLTPRYVELQKRYANNR